MAVFDRFRRNRQQSVLPDEVKQYYQAENRQRRGMALVLALVALIATVAIAAGLFFGGRFIYNKIRGNDTKTTQPAEENQGQTPDPQNPESLSDGDGEPQTPPSGQPATPPATSTPSNPETQTPAPAPAPQPAPAPSPLPHTGDEGM